MEWQGLAGGFYRLSEWLIRFLVINLLWVFTALPFSVLAFLFLFGNGPYPPILFWMALFTPLFLFPSTAAAFTSARKWVIGQEDAPLLRTFFKGYWENYRQSFLGGLFYLVAGGILGVNIYFYWHQQGVFQIFAYVAAILLLLLVLSLPFFFSMMVHVHLKFLLLVKNALFMTVISPFRAVLLLAIYLLILYLSIWYIPVFLLFFTESLLVFISYSFFHKAYLRLVEKRKSADEEAKEEDVP